MVSAPAMATATGATRLCETLPRSAGCVKVLPRRVGRIPALLPAPKLPDLVEHPSHGQRAIADVVAVVLVRARHVVVAVSIIIAWHLQMHDLLAGDGLSCSSCPPSAPTSGTSVKRGRAWSVL